MAGKTTTIQIRVDEDLKHKTAKILGRMHINMSQAIKMFLAQVVNKNGIPLEMRIPSKKVLEAMDKVDRGEGLIEVSSVEELFKELDR